MPAATQRGCARSSYGPELKRLLIRPGAIGDVLVSLPALEWAKPDEVWVPSELVPLIQFAPKVRPISGTGLDMLELGNDLAKDLLKDFDRIDSWYGSNRIEFRDAVKELPFVFHDALPDGSCHATDFYARQLGAPSGMMPQIAIRRSPSGFIACHPFSGSPKKNWPLDRFIELKRKLPIEFCIGPEQQYSDGVRFEALKDVAAWLATADAYLGNDSGITHLAAAIGVPTVVLFGPTDPAVWAPRGPHVTVLCQEGLSEYTLIDALTHAAGGLHAGRWFK